MIKYPRGSRGESGIWLDARRLDGDGVNRPMRFGVCIPQGGAALSYVVVMFPVPREVYIDDEPQGSNTAASGKLRALFVNAGEHTFRLSSPADADPAEQTVTVPERPILNPFPVEFKKC